MDLTEGQCAPSQSAGWTTNRTKKGNLQNLTVQPSNGTGKKKKNSSTMKCLANKCKELFPCRRITLQKAK